MTLTLLLRQGVFQNSYCFHIIRDSRVTQQLPAGLPVPPDTRSIRKTCATNAAPCSTMGSPKDAPNQVLHQGALYGHFCPCGLLCSSPCFTGAGPKELPPPGKLHIAPPAPSPTHRLGLGVRMDCSYLSCALKLVQFVATFCVQPVQIPAWVSYGRK